VLGVGPDPRAALPSARRRSICYPQHSAEGRRCYHRVVRPREKKTIKSSRTSRLMVYLYYCLIYEGIVLKKNEAHIRCASGRRLTPVPLMPSLPSRDGVDARICAGIRAGASTVSAVNRLTHVVGTSLPLPPTGEHDAIGGPSGIFLSPPRALC
jgi:hypothetical protein